MKLFFSELRLFGTTGGGNSIINNKNFTDAFMAIYVAFSVLLISASSLVETNLDAHFIGIIKIYYMLIIKYVLLSLFIGILTFVFRKKVIKSERKFPTSSDTIFRIDWISSLYFTIAILVGGGLLLSFNTISGKYLLVYIILIVVISLNFYFGSFWCLDIENALNTYNLELLKIEHSEWTTIYNSALIGILVFTGGITFTNFGLSSAHSLLDGIIISHVVFGAPIIWLLRPIHITMGRIRTKISILTDPKTK